MATPPPVHETDPDALETALAAANTAAASLAATGLAARAGGLRTAADALDAASEELIDLASLETRLPRQRLAGEVERTTGQLRMFADGVEEGSWLDLIIDTADPAARPAPSPDLRRMQLAVGPVLVFAASNFPFAFSVAGGDTASALAAGCPVIVKAHPGHPATSERVAEITSAALQSAGFPDGCVSLVHGQQAGVDALRDSRIRAASFTGSLGGGRALNDIASHREVPIPFYAEMGSLNPAFVSSGAIEARAEAVVSGFVASFTLGVGQFCTKPGLLFLPRGHGLTDKLIEAVSGVAAGEMLLDRIHAEHRSIREGLAARPGVRTLVHGEVDQGEPSAAAPTLLATDVPTLLADREAIMTECFGPTSIVVEYDGVDEAVAAAAELGGSLTATVHGEPGEIDYCKRLLHELRAQVGRLVWNGWPTGVAVTWAMHHGGPYPATSMPAHTSVGMTATRRFLRPVCYQDVPQELLPEELRDSNKAALPRRVDGHVTRDDVAPR